MWLPTMSYFRCVVSAGVALHDGAVDEHHEVFDKLRLEVVGVTPLPCRDLHRHAALGLHAQRLVDVDQPFGRDVAGEVDNGLAVSLCGGRCLLFL